MEKSNFNFLLHNFSRYVNCGFFFLIFARKVLGDMARTRKVLQTNGRTDIHGGKNNICVPQGETYNSLPLHIQAIGFGFKSCLRLTIASVSPSELGQCTFMRPCTSQNHFVLFLFFPEVKKKPLLDMLTIILQLQSSHVIYSNIISFKNVYIIDWL